MPEWNVTTEWLSDNWPVPVAVITVVTFIVAMLVKDWLDRRRERRQLRTRHRRGGVGTRLPSAAIEADSVVPESHSSPETSNSNDPNSQAAHRKLNDATANDLRRFSGRPLPSDVPSTAPGLQHAQWPPRARDDDASSRARPASPIACVAALVLAGATLAAQDARTSPAPGRWTLRAVRHTAPVPRARRRVTVTNAY